MVNLTTLIWVIALLAASLLHFMIWYVIGLHWSKPTPCPLHVPSISPPHDPSDPYRIDLVLSSKLMTYKANSLVNIRYPTWSLLVQQSSLPSALDCDRIVNPYASSKRQFSCQAVIFASTKVSYNLQRHIDKSKPGKAQVKALDDGEEIPTNATGFFGNVANDKGRLLQSQKMDALLRHLEDLQSQVLALLAEHGLHPGDDLIVMVLNDGEMELYANFVCSLQRHGLAEKVLRRSLVFTSSAESLPLLRAMGTIAVHHPGAFPPTSRHSSFEYLDPIFIEMMWYKSFSVWLSLRMGFQTLFMDVDLVFFQDPFDYFHKIDPQRQIDAFLSDDGQRSLRYAPFYANSGFYFLRPSPKTVYFAWSILCAFDLLHITGSHQNIYTMRLLESLDFYYMRTYFLPMRDFPSGVKFSHDRPYMRGIRDGHERPVLFHMCWTKNKEHKIVNFREAEMWYVHDDAARYLARLGEPPGRGRARDRPLAYDETNDWTSAAQRFDRAGTALLDRWYSFAPVLCAAPSSPYRMTS